ncbi:hypothetical protein Tco_0605499 [Tanacetum coccineum]
MRVSIEEILEYPKRKSTVAIKCIDGGYGKRTEELLQTLLYHSHENLDMQSSVFGYGIQRVCCSMVIAPFCLVPWGDDRSLYLSELDAVVTAWFSLWRDCD